VLGVRMLSAIRHALDEIARTEGVKVDLGEVPLDDPAAFELIRASDTLGCFQIESPGQRELLQKLQPERFEDLIVDISLFRPGPVKSDMVTPYLRRRAGMERPTYAHPALREVLGETFGVIVYHEQVMRTLAAVGGYPLAEADRIRRHLDDGEEVEAIRRDFLRRAARRGLDAASAERVWREVASFASFGFCKAHAAAFAVPTYRSAWLKARFPAQFLAGVLTHEPGMYPRRLILDDARRRGIEILPLDVNRSERGYVVEVLEEGPRRRYGIRLALADVDGISEAEIRRILEARAERPFRDVDDFLRRSGVSRPVAEALAHAGAFDGVGGGGTRRDRLYRAMTTRPGRAGDQLELDLWGSGGTRAGAPEGAGGSAERGLGGDRPAERRPPAPPGWSFPDYTDAERVRAELEVLGLDATRHLASFFEPLLDDLGVVRARDLPRHRGGEWVMVAGVKVASQTPAVRSGQRIVFLSLDDGTGVTEVTVFERTLAKVARTVFHAYAMAVWGRLRRTGVRGVGIIAEDVWDLAALHRARRDGRLARALYERAAPGLPPRKLWHASPGSAGW
jgi:error-prone DNA polymerase